MLGQQNTSHDMFSGRVTDIRVRNISTGYTIFTLQKENKTIVCKGFLLECLPGFLLSMEGYWEDDQKWGRQFIVSAANEIEEDQRTALEIIKIIPGLGTKTANQIADIVLHADKQALNLHAIKQIRAIRGISKMKCGEIVHRLRIRAVKKQIWNYLIQFGIHSVEAVDGITDIYGLRSMDELHRDPYEACMPYGIGLEVCEKMAKCENLPATGRARLRAIIRSTLEDTKGNGHTCYPYTEFVDVVKKKTKPFKGGLYEEKVPVPAITLMMDACCSSFMVKEQGVVYLRDLRMAEVRIAHSVKRLLQASFASGDDPEKLCSYAEQACNVTFESTQREAFRLLTRTGGVGILTGRPGTGKTTTLKGLLAAYELMHPHARISLCAPTGRAAQRMRESTGREAVTIHRLLEIRQCGNVLSCKNRDNPLEADLVVLDEASMLGVELAAHFFEAVKSGAMVLIVGDPDQLPSVEPGNVLQDMLDCGIIPTVVLTEVLRQAAGSLIIANADRIRNGCPDLQEGPEFEIIKASNESALAKIVLKEFVNHFDPDDIFSTQILTPARRRVSGTTSNSAALNEMIQKRINPVGSSISTADGYLREGDKVMMMRNNYDMGYYNGDMGEIKAIFSHSVAVDVDGKIIRIGKELLGDIALSYACTTHKSQGDEFDNVLIVLPPKPKNMLQCSLLYTAVTRAKKHVKIITVPGCIGTAVSRRKRAKRHSGLVRRLQAAA